MRTSYLMVSKWEHTDCKDQQELRRRVAAIGSKAQRLADEYALHLNDGEKFDMERVVKEKRAMYHVCPITASEAREYRDFWSWENAPMWPEEDKNVVS